MANAPDSAATDLDGHDFNISISALARTACWGIAAAAALALAIFAGLSESGASRVTAAVSALSGAGKEAAKTASAPSAKPDAAVVPRQPQPPERLMAETRRLNEQVRLLAADRDQLLQRVAALEHNLKGVTGSIRPQEAFAEAAADLQAEPPELLVATSAIDAAAPLWPALPLAPEPTTTPWNDPPATEAALHVEIPAPSATADRPPGTPLPLPRPVPAAARQGEPAAQPLASEPAPALQAAASPRPMPAPSRVAYGVDLGGATSLDRLRMLWRSLRTSEAGLLQGLHPLTHVREIRRGGRPDVRLIAGPLANAGHAARLCAAMLDAGRYCEPAMFRGHRLALQ